jgi:hypothetical protein
MFVRLGVAVLLAFAFVLAACGGDDAGVRAAGPSTTSSASPTSTTAPPGSSVSSPVYDPASSVPSYSRGERVTPDRNATEVHPLSFVPGEVGPADGGVVVPFWGGVPPCFVLARYEVHETAQQVTIALFAGHDASAEGVACIEIAKRYEVKVPLDAPLGNRAVVDANA